MNRKKREVASVFRILNKRKRVYLERGINVDLPTALLLGSPRRRRKRK